MGQTAHPHLENALRDLRDRFGAEASALTANEMFDLVECVRRAESPFAGVNADAIGFPVKVCEGVYLWRLTAGARCRTRRCQRALRPFSRFDSRSAVVSAVQPLSGVAPSA